MKSLINFALIKNEHEVDDLNQQTVSIAHKQQVKHRFRERFKIK